ncbi:MAG: sensor histidine kinase [Paludibacter sp.]
MIFDKEKFGWFYSKWYTFVLWVLGIALLIGLIFSLFTEKEISLFNILLPSVLNTAFLWGGSMTIVAFSWKTFPWEQYPTKHILVESLLIVLLLVVFVVGMGFLFSYNENVCFRDALRLNSSDILFTVLITFLIVTIHEAIFFYRQWKLNFSKSISLEKDNLEARYNTLKAQVNPHFLFNSLNSLITLLENNPKAEEYVQNLSEYLRYVLVSNEKPEVTIQEELENLEKFFLLQKLRFNENLIVEINVNPESLNHKIPPLALQMLVDNCIKHNIISSNHPLKIEIFDQNNNITVRNNKQLKATGESTGQGLKNIEGRFRFIGGESIKIESDEKQFSVTLPLIKAP